MRPPRIAILAFLVASSLFLLGRALTSPARYTPRPITPSARSGADRSVWGFMYYNTPFSLFPPNAAISLTDDNSTSFAARPAAFGPKLAPRGLSGQLWVGSGFAEDSIEGEGELGCSDLPAWDSGNTRNALNSLRGTTLPRLTTASRVPGRWRRNGNDLLLDRDNRKAIRGPKLEPARTPDDGTDNHLHEGIGSTASRRDNSASSHADIQSIQESAEIEGKVVLLMRGGCGFLEKVMWAQRRGAIAVIVGDNQKGGPLIQMFAHGEDVENVTIPSVFTARTTAQLLSSLTQPGSFIEDTIDDNGNAVLKVQQGAKFSKNKKESIGKRSVSSSNTSDASRQKKSAFPRDSHSTSKTNRYSWVARMFSWTQPPRVVGDRSRPPASGRLDWVLAEDSNEENGAKTDNVDDNNDFVIGVHDWRDPDLVDKARVGSQKGGKTGKKSSSSADYVVDASSTAGKTSGDPNGPKGGSITPSSGQYNPNDLPVKGSNEADSDSQNSDENGHGLISKLFGTRDNRHEPNDEIPGYSTHDEESEPSNPDEPERAPHEGLWVTITPTSSASPFFDTLLVLVVSPLITLTVVYALLLLRARIRRRRWRAPKSVVERLPVRTYHTVAPSPGPSSRLPSPSSASPTTPLLQQGPSRPRPRSRTTTGVMESENLMPPSSAIPTPRSRSRTRGRSEREKGSGGFSAEWKKYMGRQVECVVCLEEYVDGVSRVMSLPCGHEFHEDCITPWLTTRRRTCPICKGDVVRSLARGSPSTPRYDPYQDDSDEEGEASGSRPLDHDSDIEQGVLSQSHDSRRHSGGESWLSMLSGSLGSRGRPRSPSPEDRDR